MALLQRTTVGNHARATMVDVVATIRTLGPSRHRDIVKFVRSVPAPRRIVLIGSSSPYRLAHLLTREHPTAEVIVITSKRPVRAAARRVEVLRATSPGALRRMLEVRAAPDLVVQERSVRLLHPARVLRSVLPLIADGGMYVLPANCHDPETDGGESAPEMVARLAQLKRQPAVQHRSETDPDDLARAGCVDRIENRFGLLVVRRQGRALVKVRDRRAGEVLTGRLGPNWGRELCVRPSVEFASLSTLWVNDPGVDHEFRDRFTVPPRHLRLYRDALCTPRQLVVVGDVIVPISFHHPAAKRLRNRGSIDVGAHAAVPELPVEGAPRLRGTYYHLISEFPGHFGHFMTEDLGRLWGWHLARAEFRDLRLMLSVRKLGDTVPRYVFDLLEAYGIRRDQIIVIDRPTQVERLVGGTPQFHNGRYVDPDIEQTWSRLADRLVDTEAATPARIFVARPPGLTRPCHNAPEVEAFFAVRGFDVVQPDTLPIARQATLFANAEVVAGYGGSGQFNAIFRCRPAQRVVLSSDAYFASNEWLISAVKGDDYRHFWAPADVPRGARFNSASFHSGFSLDLSRDGAELARLAGPASGSR